MDKGVLRGAVIIVIALLSIFLVPAFPGPSDSIAKTLLESAAGILPFAALVIIPKLWPLPEDKPDRASMKLSGLGLGILFLEHILIWRPDILFPQNPLLGKWLEYRTDIGG